MRYMKIDKEVVQMMFKIVSLITNWITALATSITAYKESRKNTIKANNYIRQLYAILNLNYVKYMEQLNVLKEIFRIENENEELCNVKKINDLEMIAYVESIMKACQNCIAECPCKIEMPLENQEYDNLVKFYGYLKNFFMLTNQIKDMARKNNKYITIKEYKNEIIKEIPYSLRNECGGVDVDFIRFLEKFDSLINEMWENMNKKLFKIEG